MIVAAVFCLLLAFFPALLFARNLALYRPLPLLGEGQSGADTPHSKAFGSRGGTAAEELGVSVLIPARNEEANIGPALDSILASRGAEFEVIVLDDSSSDRTAEIVAAYAARDPRVRLESAPPLPPGWCGKPHACHELARHARHPVLLFIDADVRIARPDSLARLARFMAENNAALASGVPHEQTATLAEKLVVPLIHFVLLGFLPLERMRASTDPRFGAGCGQIFVARREAYQAAGGHAAIAATMHDGVALPRSFRTHGFATDLFDATDTFTCRMYRGAHEVWNGFAKNAHEGLASSRLIVPSTLLLVGGQVAPFLLLVFATSKAVAIPSALACAAAWLPRVLGVVRFRQPILGAVLHPVGVMMLLAIQWYAFARSFRGGASTWKGRAYRQEPTTAAGVPR